MKRILSVVVLLLLAVPVQAVIYKWVDHKGTVNFTEDLGNVPAEYRKKAVVVDGEAPQTEVIEVPESGPGKSGDRAKAKEPAKVEKQEEKTKALFGGKDERTWRNEFAQAKGNLKAAEDDLESLRRRLLDTSKMSRSEYLSIQNSIRYGEQRVKDLKEKLEGLTRSADKAGVPAAMRE